jgi:hypothetical protein
LIGADASGINLESLSKYLKQANILSMSMRGSMNLSANEFVIDPSFKKQPNGNLNLAVSTFLLPSFRFSALGIPIAIPEMRLGQMKMDARMKDGQLEIQGLSIGAKGSPLTGTAKGRVDISFARSAADSMASRGQIQTLINGADLYFDLSVSRELMADPTMSVALNTLLSACRQDSATGTRFNCHMIYDPLKSSQPAFLRAQ